MKLTITDLSKLKITKTKLWAIYFDYDGEKYLLHEGGECYEETVILYKRIDLNGLGKYKLELMEESYSGAISSILDYIETKGNTYSKIDKEYFVKKLTYDGFVDGMYDNYIAEMKQSIKNINKEIQNNQNKINELQGLKNELMRME